MTRIATFKGRGTAGAACSCEGCTQSTSNTAMTPLCLYTYTEGFASIEPQTCHISGGKLIPHLDHFHCTDKWCYSDKCEPTPLRDNLTEQENSNDKKRSA